MSKETTDADCPICEGTGEHTSEPGKRCDVCFGFGRLPIFNEAEWELAKDEARYGKP